MFSICVNQTKMNPIFTTKQFLASWYTRNGNKVSLNFCYKFDCLCP